MVNLRATSYGTKRQTIDLLVGLEGVTSELNAYIAQHARVVSVSNSTRKRTFPKSNRILIHINLLFPAAKVGHVYDEKMAVLLHYAFFAVTSRLQAL